MEYKGKLYAKIAGKYIECTESIQDLENKIEQLSIIFKDINGLPIKKGQKFKFKYQLDRLNAYSIELIGSFDWNNYELRYEIDIWGNNHYTCLYYDPDVMYDFKLL